MWMENEEHATPKVRWNSYTADAKPRLEQKWNCRKGRVTWQEWREVPTVVEPWGQKTFTSAETMD